MNGAPKSSRGQGRPRGDQAPDLASLETLLYRLITAPNGVDEALATEEELTRRGLEHIIASDDRLSARERIEIYANAYFFRLLDVFKEDYPALLAVIGDTNFHNLITGYLIHHPPTAPSVFYAGRHLPEFLCTHPMGERWPFLADLATLERATLDVFHAADAQPLSHEAARAIPPQNWPAIRFQLHPAARLLDLAWTVDLLLRAVMASNAWRTPEHSATPILVWRSNSQVYYREMERAEYLALQLATDGATFDAACEAIVAQTDTAADSAAQINQWLARWVSDGVLTLLQP
jgi:hypothetical protein